MQPNRLQVARGFRDWLPEDTEAIRDLEAVARAQFQSYGYREISTPLVEPGELFLRGVGATTDIAQKEMYWLQSAGDSEDPRLVLRPEATASCVRAGLQHGLLRHQSPRWFYMGPMFRRERPQKGRYRQFLQIGAECFGANEPAADVELLLFVRQFLERVGVLPHVQLEINSLGSPQARGRYLVDLRRFFEDVCPKDSEGLQTRIRANPLRLLDKPPQELLPHLSHAPKLEDYLSPECKAHFHAVLAGLDAHQCPYVISPRLVRGLDYYNRTVFEWTTCGLGAQGTVCGGGRYDDLVALLGGDPTPAVGFSIGVERLLLLRQTSPVPRVCKTRPSVAVINYSGEAGSWTSLRTAQRLRGQYPGWTVLNFPHLRGSKALQEAERAGARYAVLIETTQERASNPSLKLRCLRTRTNWDTHWETFASQLAERMEKP